MQEQISISRYNRLIIHTPHAGTLLPIYSHCHPMGRSVRVQAIAPLSLQLTDRYTDELFHADAPLSVSKLRKVYHISFPFSRLFCDVERFISDPREEKGLGICYDVERFINKKPHSWYGAWSMTKQQAMELYNAHHAALCQATSRGDLLLDCHSFSERPNILCPNANDFKDVDICLGFNDDDSRAAEETLSYIKNFFQFNGYRVELNKPFSNAITTGRCQSLMIEVNKHCYMNEDSYQVTDGYYNLHRILQVLYNSLLVK